MPPEPVDASPDGPASEPEPDRNSAPAGQDPRATDRDVDQDAEPDVSDVDTPGTPSDYYEPL